MIKDTKLQIQEALQGFMANSIREASVSFLGSLGYKSDRVFDIENTPEAFLKKFDTRDRPFNKEKAQYDCWKTIDFLFQITDDEVQREGGQPALEFSSDVDTSNFQSYLFFAVDLEKGHYTRTHLSQITREINLLFNMPVLILLRHNGTLTFAIIDRRLHKKNEHSDVLDKVKLIKDIRCEDPHRAHIEILHDLSLQELILEHQCTSLTELHEAWRTTLDIDALNKKFYRELADWYFWALDHVEFPDDIEKDTETRNATNVIRLLTRLIFCWFLKEKGLIPDNLFKTEELDGVLRSLKDDKSTFYHAILQNLFFGTLNQRMNTGSKVYRKFASDGTRSEQRNEYGIKNIYRYQKLFAVDEDEAINLFSSIPFMNGGLFDCLDKEDENGKIVYVDGFTRNNKKQPKIPNFLFFSDEQSIDLSRAYGDKKHTKEKVRGLINLLNGYKFTITENTPIEEEIALDPELLGKVFENLLASYNPETKTTARKQTGSFYTPREIVNYMVDESLIAYLETKLKERMPRLAKMDDLQELLREVFAYTEKEHPFKGKEIEVIIEAIDSCKILDPACGSGAFPMGILHKLVFILSKLDPHNNKWKQKQLDKVESIPDQEARAKAEEAIEKEFENNELDYGRKLYLIENCIYGVDIQPIATQISKLRFFISLICDQKTNKDKTKNCGIRPLPNLETKFVSANSLISIDCAEGQSLLTDHRLPELEEELKKIRHKYFATQISSKKIALQKKDAELRDQISEILEQGGMGSDKSHQLSEWNPYNQNISSKFFDPEWMFGIDDGFNIVIGNPPYVSYGLRGAGKLSAEEQSLLKKRFPNSAEYKISLYALFMEKAIRLASDSGFTTFIVPDSFLLGKYFSKIRKYILNICSIHYLMLIKDRVFENVTIGQSVIYLCQKSKCMGTTQTRIILGNEDSITRGISPFSYNQTYFKSINRNRFRLLFNKNTLAIIQKLDAASSIKPLGELVKFRSGLISKKGQDAIRSIVEKKGHWGKGIFSGGSVHPYIVVYKDEYLCYDPKVIKSGGVKTVNYFEPKLFVRQTGDSLICAYDEENLLALNNVHIGNRLDDSEVTLKYVAALLNSRLIEFYYKSTSLEEGRAMAQVDIDMLDAIPILIPSKSHLESIEHQIDEILAKKTNGSDAEMSDIKREIDLLVFEIYGLAEEEIDFIEEHVK